MQIQCRRPAENRHKEENSPGTVSSTRRLARVSARLLALVGWTKRQGRACALGALQLELAHWGGSAPPGVASVAAYGSQAVRTCPQRGPAARSPPGPPCEWRSRGQGRQQSMLGPPASLRSSKRAGGSHTGDHRCRTARRNARRRRSAKRDWRAGRFANSSFWPDWRKSPSAASRCTSEVPTLGDYPQFSADVAF